MQTRNILIILSFIITFSNAEMNRSSDGIVTDDKTQLQWQDNYDENGGDVKTASWLEAIEYCENLTLGGYLDWRLPNIKELYSLVDHTQYDPAIDPVFLFTENGFYWTSTHSSPRRNGYAYHPYNISFSEGSLNTQYSTGDTLYVRCVRTAKK